MVQIDQNQINEIDNRIIEIDQRLQYLMDLSMRHGKSEEIITEKEELELEKSSLYIKKETMLNVDVVKPTKNPNKNIVITKGVMKVDEIKPVKPKKAAKGSAFKSKK